MSVHTCAEAVVEVEQGREEGRAWGLLHPMLCHSAHMNSCTRLEALCVTCEDRDSLGGPVAGPGATPVTAALCCMLADVKDGIRSFVSPFPPQKWQSAITWWTHFADVWKTWYKLANVTQSGFSCSH